MKLKEYWVVYLLVSLVFLAFVLTKLFPDIKIADLVMGTAIAVN